MLTADCIRYGTARIQKHGTVMGRTAIRVFGTLRIDRNGKKALIWENI